MLKHTTRGARDDQGISKPDRTHHDAKMDKDEYDLADMLDQVEPASCHPEQDTGPPQGKEEL